MAIDSQTKRMSIAQLGGGKAFLPRADNVITEPDRKLLLGLYSFADSSGGSGNIWWFIYS